MRQHCFRPETEEDGAVMEEGNRDVLTEITQENIYEKRTNTIETKLLRKFIRLASKITVTLSKKASEKISAYFVDARDDSLLSSDYVRSLPVTPRSCESLIRLGSSVCKGHLETVVTENHVNIAINIFSKCSVIQIDNRHHNSFKTSNRLGFFISKTDEIKEFQSYLVLLQRRKNNIEYLSFHDIQQEKKYSQQQIDQFLYILQNENKIQIDMEGIFFL